MARIEDKKVKNNKKEGGKFWTGFLATILGAVVIAGIVIGAIMIFGKKDDDGETEEKTYEELFPKANLITFEELGSIFDIHTPDQDLLVDGTIYVFVYSPAYVESLEEGSSAYKNYYNYIETSVNKAAELFDEEYEGNDAFYVINTLSEDNKNLTIADAEIVNNSGEDLSTLTGPYLLVISRGDNNEFEIPQNGVKENREISSVLNRLTKE